MNNIHNSLSGLTTKEKKLHDFLMEYATVEEIDLLDLHITNKDFKQADMIIEQIMSRIT